VIGYRTRRESSRRWGRAGLGIGIVPYRRSPASAGGAVLLRPHRRRTTILDPEGVTRARNRGPRVINDLLMAFEEVAGATLAPRKLTQRTFVRARASTVTLPPWRFDIAVNARQPQSSFRPPARGPLRIERCGKPPPCNRRKRDDRCSARAPGPASLTVLVGCRSHLAAADRGPFPPAGALAKPCRREFCRACSKPIAMAETTSAPRGRRRHLGTSRCLKDAFVPRDDRSKRGPMSIRVGRRTAPARRPQGAISSRLRGCARARPFLVADDVKVSARAGRVEFEYSGLVRVFLFFTRYPRRP